MNTIPFGMNSLEGENRTSSCCAVKNTCTMAENVGEDAGVKKMRWSFKTGGWVSSSSSSSGNLPGTKLNLDCWVLIAGLI